MHAISVVQAAADSGHVQMGVGEVWIALSTDWIDMGEIKDVGLSSCLEVQNPAGETAGTAVKGVRRLHCGREVGIDEHWDTWGRVWSANSRGRGGRAPSEGWGIF